MKNIVDIPECSKLIDKMLDEIDKLPSAIGLDSNQRAEKKIRIIISL